MSRNKTFIRARPHVAVIDPRWRYS